MFCGSFKPIFHWILGLCWLPNANEIDTKNMLCTWLTQEICVWYLTQPTDLCLGFASRVMQILGLVSGVKQIFVFLDTNMLVSPRPNCGLGVFLSQWNKGFNEGHWRLAMKQKGGGGVCNFKRFQAFSMWDGNVLP